MADDTKSDRPCRLAPEVWFGSRVEQGQAIHMCLNHCTRLAECRREPAAVHGVIAGVAYGLDGPLKAHRQPRPVSCGECRAAGPGDTGRCGTDAGATAHRRRGEQPCMPCRRAHAAKELERLRARRAAA